MQTLKTLKRSSLHALKRAGGFDLVGRSRWRRNRLLILCYHGISLEDEHEWNSDLYMHPQDFERRLEILRETGCSVLSLSEGIERLYANDLPPRSVTLTFDDGMYDFCARAWPLLKAYGLPATVYLTTYYCGRPLPIFDLACFYVLWKGRGAVLDGGLPEFGRALDLRTPEAVDRARWTVLGFARKHGLGTAAKQELLEKLARAVGFDDRQMLQKRVFQLMTPDEVAEMSREGVDFQLHTHRHRTPQDRDAFLKEIQENRKEIQTYAGTRAVDFCYPSGVHRPEFLPWLAEASVRSATTCEPGLASPRSNALLLPRVVDHTSLSPVEFEAWLSGCASFLPGRPRFGLP